MQTFLPEPDFDASAKSLDRQRLGKQRVENLQIMKALLGLSEGWKNHPATKMWRGYELALLEYQRAICAEWVRRGYRDTCLQKSEDMYRSLGISGDAIYPPWWGGEIHDSHKSALIRKDPEFYGDKWPSISRDIAYVWPELD